MDRRNLCIVLLLAAAPAHAQEQAIRDAALNHSQIMETAGYLTDVIGPRLTGSPNYKRAAEYARHRLRAWGLANAHLEAWGPFGRGWSLEGFTANMLAPDFSPLIAYPKAWSPGTNGTVRGEAIFLYVKTAADLDRYHGKLKGKIVLFSPARQVDPLFDPPAQRQTDEELLRLANAPPWVDPAPFYFTPEQRAAEELSYRKWQLIQSEGAGVVLQPSYGDAGTVYVTAATVPYPPDVPFDKRAHAWDLSRPVVTPQANVAAEQYNRIVRLLARGIPVQLEVNIAARFYGDDPLSYNVIAEIPGTDLQDEVVMAGASDHVSFDEIGLPAFQWIRDYMEGSHTRAPHTNMDTYDHLLEDDLQQSAAVAASVVWQLAMRDERVPRKPPVPH